MTYPPADLAAQAKPNLPEYSVSEVSGAIKRTLEEGFGYVRVRGEISGFKLHGSGHIYLTLKDDKAALSAVLWRGNAARLRFPPEDGLEVICTGRITTYPGRSTYQLVIDTMEPAGAGALMALLEERRKTLAAEGLFDSARKRPIPFLPQVIGVVTSPTGAVIRDIMHRLNERFPRHVLVWPVVVQGEAAAGQVAAAIAGFNALGQGAIPRPDVLIVARGGGGIEDLWAFNEEIVVRAVAASAIPVISAVGHETDTTLIDHVSDKRCPTPTAAAELAVPVRADLLATVIDLDRRLLGGMARTLDHRRQMVAGLARGLPRPRDLLGLAQQRFDELAERLPRALTAGTVAHERRLLKAASGLAPRLLADGIARRRQAWRDLSLRLPRALAANSTQHRHRLLEAASGLAPRFLADGIARRHQAWSDLTLRLPRALAANTAQHRHRLLQASAGLKPRRLFERIAQNRRQADEFSGRLGRCGQARLQDARLRFAGVERLLASLDYRRVLDRGFAIVRDAAGKPLMSAGEAKSGDRLEIEFRDGKTSVAVDAAGARPAVKPRAGPADQGKLF